MAACSRFQHGPRRGGFGTPDLVIGQRIPTLTSAVKNSQSAGMVIPGSPPLKNAGDGAAQPEPQTPDAPTLLHNITSAAATPPASTLGYAEFEAALREALRDIHSPDLLARNPLLRSGIGGLGALAGPSELRALLCETVDTLFGNAHDERLRRVLQLTYSQSPLKQEAIADRLALSFGTYRRYLANARERLALWLWENAQPTSVKLSPSPDTGSSENGGHDKRPVPSRVDVSAAPRLSLVVLPFLNLSPVIPYDPFVDGITETLTTDLSCLAGLFVVSRSAAFAYRDKRVDARAIGRELGVRYILEGSVQAVGNRTRLNAQLVDAESGAHLWAERFDKEQTNPLDLQDEITSRLSRTIHVELIAAESRRVARERPDDLDAIDHTLRGWAALNQHLSLEVAREARRFFEAALRLDPDNVSALVGVASAHMWEVNMYISDDRVGQIRAAEAAATKALNLAPNSAQAHLTYGIVLYAMRGADRALREFEFAIRLDGKLAAAHAYLGLMKVFLGRPGEAHLHVAEAMRLSPRDPLLFLWHFYIGVADIHRGRVVQPLESLRRSVEINPHWGLSQFVLAGALGLAGLLAEAEEVCAVARRLAPKFTIAKFRAEAVSDNSVYLAAREHFCEGLRLAGVPEG
jgi:TolB-like protein/Tfp pilus assembly protein PilF